MTEQSFRYRFRVRYNECDAQNVVFNARYADYIDLAMTEFMRALGYDYIGLLERGLDNQVVKMTLEWQAPARFDDVLDIRVKSPRVGNSSFDLAFAIVNAASGQRLCTASVVYVLIDTQPFTKVRVPDDVRNALNKGAPGVSIDQSGAAGTG